jgi:hypothetical protein
MDLRECWSMLSPLEQQWLLEHNGVKLSGQIVTAIRRAGGSFVADSWWAEAGGGPSGFLLTDEAVDWLEAIANGEIPTPRR